MRSSMVAQDRGVRTGQALGAAPLPPMAQDLSVALPVPTGIGADPHVVTGPIGRADQRALGSEISIELLSRSTARILLVTSNAATL